MQQSKFLICGHLVNVEFNVEHPCPFCEDYEEARALHALEELLDPCDRSEVPHTRE